MSALKKLPFEEWGGVYVGVQATPTPPHIPVLFSRLTFFQWSQYIGILHRVEKTMRYVTPSMAVLLELFVF